MEVQVRQPPLHALNIHLTSKNYRQQARWSYKLLQDTYFDVPVERAETHILRCQASKHRAVVWWIIFISGTLPPPSFLRRRHRAFTTHAILNARKAKLCLDSENTHIHIRTHARTRTAPPRCNIHETLWKMVSKQYVAQMIVISIDSHWSWFVVKRGSRLIGGVIKSSRTWKESTNHKEIECVLQLQPRRKVLRLSEFSAQMIPRWDSGNIIFSAKKKKKKKLASTGWWLLLLQGCWAEQYSNYNMQVPSRGGSTWHSLCTIICNASW